jgi:VanZ family protein
MHTKQPRIISHLVVIARIAAWGLAITIVVLSVVPPTLRPETFLPHHLEHFAIYAITGSAFALGYWLTPSLLAVQLVVFSGCVEIMQLFVPGRHARLSDFVVDAVATCAGVVAAELIKRTTADPSAWPIPGD